MTNPLINIDYAKLRNQKESLLKVIDTMEVSDLSDDLQGILHLIDGIQDYAVDELGKEESVVFNLESDEDIEEVNQPESEQIIPDEINTILNSMDENKCKYKECERISKELLNRGWTCDYGLDGEIYGVWC